MNIVVLALAHKHKMPAKDGGAGVAPASANKIDLALKHRTSNGHHPFSVTRPVQLPTPGWQNDANSDL
jgi:hypothetical protein